MALPALPALCGSKRRTRIDRLQTTTSKPDPSKQASGWTPPFDSRATQHQEFAGQLDVHNTLLRRWATLLALKTTARFFPAAGRIAPISRRLLVKRDTFVNLTEASTMRYVAANTSIPVPRVHCAFVHKDVAYIVMERVQGVTLATALATASEAERDSLLEQLRALIKELRSIASPQGTGVHSCVGGSLSDCRIPAARPRLGPFTTINDFHVWLRDGLRLEDIPGGESHKDWQGLNEMVAKQDGPWLQPCVFTHADLNPFNVLVRGDRIVSIIDWEFSGWYPYYWEYTSVWYGSRLNTFWQDMIPKWLDTHPDDLKMEITRQRYWGDF